MAIEKKGARSSTAKSPVKKGASAKGARHPVAGTKKAAAKRPAGRAGSSSSSRTAAKPASALERRTPAAKPTVGRSAARGMAQKASVKTATASVSKASKKPGPAKSGPGAKLGLAPKVNAQVKGALDPNQERLQLLRQEKVELQEIARHLRAERDSALAETTRLQDRVRELETEQSRRSSQEPQQAGPGTFDPTVDLEEDGNAMAEEDLEGAAGFFDRIDELRARRGELDRERADRELEQSDQPFWMICPKCGDLMEEQEAENIKLERCETCGGLYLDRGEADLMISLTADRDGVRRLHHALKF